MPCFSNSSLNSFKWKNFPLLPYPINNLNMTLKTISNIKSTTLNFQKLSIKFLNTRNN